MNVETGHVISQTEYDSLLSAERRKYVGVPRHMAAVAGAAMVAGHSLFQGKHVGQQVRSQARDLARKHKAKMRRKIAKDSQRRNRV